MTQDEIIQKHPEVQERLKVIKFFNQYGWKITHDAFGYARSTVYLWKKNLREKGIKGLIKQSTRPHNTRKMYLDPKIYQFIKSLREQYPRLGKEKIKPLLDQYCQENNLETISVSKIGRVMKANNWFFYLGKRTRKRKTIKRDKKRVFGYQVNQPGDLFQIDTIVRFEQGIKRYIITAIDTVSRFAFAWAYKTGSSASAADFAKKLIKVVPYPIRAIQTDNGSEFLKTFDQTIAQQGIVHFFTYPRCPKQNGVIERFNRTLQEEFLENHRELLELSSPDQFNHHLIDYLLFYNTKRPHYSLNYQVPMKVVVNYLKEKLQKKTPNQKQGLESKMLWTDT